MLNTTLTLQAMKQGQEKISMIAAYDYTTAKLLDEVGVNIILVGDSLAMVMLGLEDTLSIGMSEMLHHVKAVARGTKEAFILADMPFMSYQESTQKAVKNAGRLMKEGRANGVKLEGDFMAEIKAISKAFIPVVSHLGLTPQSIHTLGGFKVQAKSLKAAQKLLDDARRAQDNGAFMLLLECVPQALAAKITKELEIPVIGIGAGKDCDGQVLVLNDLLGLNTDFKPKFVKVFENSRVSMQKGVKAYIKELKNGTYPAKEHSFSCDEDLIAKLV